MLLVCVCFWASGMHVCQDVYCVTCDTNVGWKYVRAKCRDERPHRVVLDASRLRFQLNSPRNPGREAWFSLLDQRFKREDVARMTRAAAKLVWSDFLLWSRQASQRNCNSCQSIRLRTRSFELGSRPGHRQVLFLRERIHTNSHEYKQIVPRRMPCYPESH